MKLYDIFSIEYGRFKTPINRLKNGSTPLISSGSKNNGIVGFFNISPLYKNIISVPRVGTICHAFYHGYNCNITDNCLVLTPLVEYNLKELFYFVLLVRAEKNKYIYGRQVTPDRLGNTIIPDNIPEWVNDIEIDTFENLASPLNHEKQQFSTQDWTWFKYSDLFEIKKGKRIVNREMKPGKTPCVRPIESNNGVYRFIDIIPNHKGNTISVNYNGSVGEAFYQPIDYFALDDINVLYPKFELNSYVGMFLVTIIRKEKYRFNYGRKWHLERMKESLIKLPVTQEGNPDWQFMEDYIKSLPYSKALE